MHAGGGEQLRHMHERRAIFMLRRCVHQDQAAVAQADTEITPKTGIARGWGQIEA
jgi:hypothetical protein